MWIGGTEPGSENVWYERVVSIFVGSILIKNIHEAIRVFYFRLFYDRPHTKFGAR